MFEEAAGVAKFKSRKDEAERKLDRTHENLVRIDDIRSEIERQMGPLKKFKTNHFNLFKIHKFHLKIVILK